MKKKIKVWLTVIVSLVMILTTLSVGVMAKDNGYSIDNELLEILYKKTDNPELWAEFIEQNSDDEIGKWLPLFIKKITAEDETTMKKIVEVKYKTVTEAFDWGPAINKVIVEVGTVVSASALDIETFDVTSVRTFKDFDFATFSLAENETDHEVSREVTKVYVSDSKGNEKVNGAFVTIVMAVGPTLTEGSPYNYNILTGFNENVKTGYKISVTSGAELMSSEGEELTILPTGIEEKTGDIKVIADTFVQDQLFSYDGVDLQYASFTPEMLSKVSRPLIIWLHGAGEGGTDTTIALMGNEVVNLATDEYQAFFGDNGADILVPQSPTMWMDIDGTGTYNDTVEGSNGSSYYTEALMALIDTYVKNHPEIDTDRIYIGGCSNGGYMTVNMIMSYPEYFAAAYPICEAYSVDWIIDEKVESIKEIPIWLTHAYSDSVVKIAEGTVVGNTGYSLTLDEHDNPIPLDDYSNALYNRLVDKGAKNVHYSLFDEVVDTSGLYKNEDGTPYEYMGHWSWVYALNNESVSTINGVKVTLFEWLGQQSK